MMARYDLPVQNPTKFEAFGLSVPQSRLVRADEVIDQALFLLHRVCRLVALL